METLSIYSYYFAVVGVCATFHSRSSSVNRECVSTRGARLETRSFGCVSRAFLRRRTGSWLVVRAASRVSGVPEFIEAQPTSTKGHDSPPAFNPSYALAPFAADLQIVRSRKVLALVILRGLFYVATVVNDDVTRMLDGKDGLLFSAHVFLLFLFMANRREGEKNTDDQLLKFVPMNNCSWVT